MPDIEDQERPQGRAPNAEEASAQHEDGIQSWLRIATVFLCVVNFAYVVGIAVLIGKLKGWYYSIHCFILCLLVLWNIIQTIKAKAKLQIKMTCWGSCSTLCLVLTTSFTLLTRQAYYHPSPHFEPKWVLFSLQASIIPLLGGILVMYECNIHNLYEDRYILMIAVVDFADIWDMASILSEHRAPFLKEESPLEITVQFFCSLSFTIFSILINKNIAQECTKLVFNNDGQQDNNNQDNNAQASVHDLLNHFCSGVVNSNSQLYQNIPFLIIRIFLFKEHKYIDFDYFAKNMISVILYFLGCCSCERQDE